MKRIRITLMFFILYFGLFDNAMGQVLSAENSQSSQELYDFHINKKKANNTAAWITLGGGVAMIVGGLGINTSGGIIDGDSTNNDKGLWLSYIGAATTVVSIPLFISAGKHNRKAKVELKNGAIGFNKNLNYSLISVTFSF